MDSPAYLSYLCRELGSFRNCLSGDLAAPVEHCGDWTLLDLAEHLGAGNLWAAVAITEKHGDHQAEPAPRNDRDGFVSWFDATCSQLLTALNGNPDSAAWTIYPPHTVGFWQRRRCMETVTHRWDAEHALGAPQTIEPELASDGVAEVLEVMAPRQVALERTQAPEHSVRLVASDTDASWVYGPGDPVATLTATAETLFLTLWGRRTPSTEAACTWEGNQEAGQALLRNSLVP
ncbi:hypothetical protein GCM10009716_17870 [Streptomyces sodiiphilus]|uniref:Maleylpyruvate isomerase family mycothiol-dependent enzyme n=1 Tax=Streptomyces sodiiphilus TaxID=226217 RepID=A0ABN2NZV0_9ACTN